MDIRYNASDIKRLIKADLEKGMALFKDRDVLIIDAQFYEERECITVTNSDLRG